MRALTLLSLALPLFVAALPGTPAPGATPFMAKVTYDNTYDNPNGSLNSVACSNGANGLVTRGFTDFKSLPTFPNIGGAQAVAAWNSTNCGSCWSLTFQGNTVKVTAIDTAGVGFNVAQETLDFLTNGQAVQRGFAEVTAVQVPSSECGL